MEQIKTIIGDFQKKLQALGFDEQQIASILYEVVLIASAKLGETDLSFLTKEEMDFVSNKDLLQLDQQQLHDITSSNPNLMKYLDIYANELRSSIDEFDKIVEEVKQEERSVETNPEPNPSE